MHPQLSNSFLSIFLTKIFSQTVFILHVGLRGLCFSKNNVDRLNAHSSGLSLLGWQQDQLLIFHSPRIVVYTKLTWPCLGTWKLCLRTNCKISWGISICSNRLVPPVYIHVYNFIKKILQEDTMVSYYWSTGTAKEKCAIFHFVYLNCMSS